MVTRKEAAKEVKPVPSYCLDNDLELYVKARYGAVQLSSSQTQILPVVVTLKAKELTEAQESRRSPIDLVCVIDISGSMEG